MRPVHPFQWLPKTAQKRVFIVLFVFTIAVMAALQVLGGPLKTKAAPAGIVSFELAGGLEKAREMVASWGPRERVYAGLNLGLDFLFLVTYSSCIGLGCVLVAQGLAKPEGMFSFTGVVLGWGQFAAALLDAVENVALIQVLLGSGQAQWPVIACWCAVPKFTIVVLGLVYFLAGGVVVLLARTRGPNGREA